MTDFPLTQMSSNSLTRNTELLLLGGTEQFENVHLCWPSADVLVMDDHVVIWFQNSVYVTIFATCLGLVTKAHANIGWSCCLYHYGQNNDRKDHIHINALNLWNYIKHNTIIEKIIWLLKDLSNKYLIFTV